MFAVNVFDGKLHSDLSVLLNWFIKLSLSDHAGLSLSPPPPHHPFPSVCLSVCPFVCVCMYISVYIMYVCMYVCTYVRTYVYL